MSKTNHSDTLLWQESPINDTLKHQKGTQKYYFVLRMFSKLCCHLLQTSISLVIRLAVMAKIIILGCPWKEVQNSLSSQNHNCTCVDSLKWLATFYWLHLPQFQTLKISIYLLVDPWTWADDLQISIRCITWPGTQIDTILWRFWAYLGQWWQHGTNVSRLSE